MERKTTRLNRFATAGKEKNRRIGFAPGRRIFFSLGRALLVCTGNWLSETGRRQSDKVEFRSRGKKTRPVYFLPGHFLTTNEFSGAASTGESAARLRGRNSMADAPPSDFEECSSFNRGG